MFNTLHNPECPVCRGGDGETVCAMAQRGDSDVEIAEKSGYRAEAVDYHLAHIIACGVEQADDSSPETILQILRANAARLEAAIAYASQGDDSTLFLRSSSELTKNLALQNEIANRRDTENPLTETAQIRSLARKLFSAVNDSPEMRKALSAALRSVFGGDDEYAEYL